MTEFTGPIFSQESVNERRAYGLGNGVWVSLETAKCVLHPESLEFQTMIWHQASPTKTHLQAEIGHELPVGKVRMRKPVRGRQRKRKTLTSTEGGAS